MTNAVSLAQQASTGVSPGFRNRIINGGMTIDQRNAGAAVTSSGGFAVDRWKSYFSQVPYLTMQQNAGSVTPPVGFTNYLGVTTTTPFSVGSSDEFVVFQYIEGFNTSDLGWGTANAKTVTLSFWVRSSLTGTFGGAIQNSGSPSYRSYPYSYTISAANTWEYKTVTITGDTSGTWLTNNGIGLGVFFGLGQGSNRSATAGAWATGNFNNATGATSVVGTNGATFYITGVQLEVGSTATSFDYRPIGTELSLCQRYYWKNPDKYYYYKSRELDRARAASVPFPVEMRAAPTITKITDPAGFTWTWSTPSVTCVPGSGTAPSDGYTDVTGVMAASAEL
jgi:hypothetical protein